MAEAGLPELHQRCLVRRALGDPVYSCAVLLTLFALYQLHRSLSAGDR